MSWVGDVLGDLWDYVEDAWDAFIEQIIDIPEIPESDVVINTVSEGVFIARCYGKCKIGGNKIRVNASSDNSTRILLGHCLGEVEGIDTIYVNDIEWSSLKGSPTKTEYTGTRTQTADGRFTSRASAYRGIAYTAFTFGKGDKVIKQIGRDPNITVVMEGLKCAPLAGGADAFTRNPAVILYDWYLNVEGYSSGDLSTLDFQSLEELCDEEIVSGEPPRYRFDYSFGTNIAINDAKKLIWQSFNGRVVMSQGKLKPVWDSGQMADGAGSLTAKTVSHAFAEDNVVKGSFTWKQPERPNIVRVHYRDSDKEYKNSSVEIKDEDDIAENGEILYEEKAWYITDAELARRRAKYKSNKFKYEDYECEFSSHSGGGDLEVLDLVTVTHSLPGWTTKQFIVISKSEGASGILKFKLRAYYSGVYDDSEVGDQAGYGTVLPNPYAEPPASTSIAATLVTTGNDHNYDAVQISFTPPATDQFYSYTKIYASNDDATYYLVGTSSGEDFILNGMGTVYQPGETCYIKLVSVNELGVEEDLPGSYDASVVISGSIRIGGFYVGSTFFGDNATQNDAKILLDKTNTLLRLGPTSGNYITVDGDYNGEPAVHTSNYASGVNGAGLLLTADLLEVGNVAVRGILRSAVFQKDVVSAIGGNLMVRPADVLASDMTASDTATMDIEDNETFEVGDFLRIKDGLDDEWLEVTSVDSDLTYHVTRDKGGDYGAGANPAWKKGATVVNYGQTDSSSEAGGIYLTASETNAPYISVFTHDNVPWTTITEQMRIGNLNGFLGYSSDIYGFAVGETDEYIKIDPTNGVQISSEKANAITIKGGADILLEGSDTDPGKIIFEGTSYTVEMGGDADGDRFTIAPATDDVTECYIGGPPFFHTDKYFTKAYISTIDGIYLTAASSGTPDTLDSSLSVTSTATYQRVSLNAHIGGIKRSVTFEHDSSGSDFMPSIDNTINLGTAALGWKNVFCKSLIGGEVILPYWMSDDATEFTTGNTSYQDYTYGFRIYVPADATNVRLAARVKGSSSGNIGLQLDVGGQSDNEDPLAVTSTYGWNTNILVDVSSLSGWYDAIIQIRAVTVNAYLQGFSMIWEI